MIRCLGSRLDLGLSCAGGLKGSGFCGGLVCRLREVVGSGGFSARLIGVVSHVVDWLWRWCVAGGCVFGGRPGRGWRLCFPLWLHTGGSGFGLCDGSDFETCLLMGWWGLVLWLLSGPPGFACWVSFAPMFGFVCCWVLVLNLFCLLFVSWCVCVLWDGALLGWESFLRARHLCVLIRVWAGVGVVGRFGPSSGVFLLAVSEQCFFCGSFVLFLSCFVFLSCASVCWCLVVACWWLASWLSFVMSNCDVVTFPLVSWVRCGA